MHDVNLRVRVIYDPEPDLSYLDQDTFSDTSPEDIESLAVVAEAQCACCERWESLRSSLWNIDFRVTDHTLVGIPYDGDPFTPLLQPDAPGGTYTGAELREWMESYPPEAGRHYLAECALEILSEGHAELVERGRVKGPKHGH